jgi:hypothetical protein
VFHCDWMWHGFSIGIIVLFWALTAKRHQTVPGSREENWTTMWQIHIVREHKNGYPPYSHDSSHCANEISIHSGRNPLETIFARWVYLTNQFITRSFLETAGGEKRRNETERNGQCISWEGRYHKSWCSIAKS